MTADHITQPYTLAELRAKIASHDYSAELLLQHAMLLLDRQAPAEGDDKPREPAPLNDLPSWSECDLIISNHEFRQRAAAGLEGQVLDLPPVTPPPTALHRFIHEYDDSDPYRSDWFMHRLELVVKEAQANVQPKRAEPVARVHVRSVTPGRIDELDVLRPLPQGTHLLYAAPVQTPAPGDEQGAFETWASRSGYYVKRSDKNPARYHAWLTNALWDGWQGRAAFRGDSQ